MADDEPSTVLRNKKRKELVTNAMKLSIKYDQDVLVAIHDKEENKLVVYQNTKEFNTMQLNKLLSCHETRKNYEEYTNKNFKQSGKYKMQTFHLRLDNDNQGTTWI